MTFSRKYIICLIISLPVALSCYTEAKAQTAKTNSEAWKELIRFENKNLIELDEKTRGRIEVSVNQVIPGRKNPGVSNIRERFPWYLWKIESTDGQAKFVLLEGQSVITIPGQAWLHVHFFDVAGTLLSSRDFSAGWRLSPLKATIVRRKGIDAPLLEISTDGEVSAARQYYALIGNDLALIRLETRWGTPVRNIYEYPNRAIGPPLPRRSAEQWEQALVTFEPVEVLRSLMWLGGIHRQPWQESDRDEPKESDHPLDAIEIYQEDIEEAKLVREVRTRPRMHGFLLAMTLSENLWIRQAAERVLTP